MSEAGQAAYRVLARKYRPRNFAELIGQEPMVRTLRNAIETGRLAHAFVLTGVRGVGKTTTARIIARALNCIGADGGGGATIEPCGVCENCVAIAEDRHQDVLEMDAASRTGVDDIRELIDGVRYLPVAARYKIYIIDEVHMLSRNAFNALLKTLEEPPAHVKFIFATTEIRKVPVTVLSRCQRFDLRRVEGARLVDYFREITAKETVEADDEALALIARAAEGSVRDGLSLLDQAIAHTGGAIGGDAVRDMLGLADRARTLELFEAVLGGGIKAALANLRAQYAAGADPMVVFQDLLALCHWVTDVKINPDAGGDVTVSEAERVRGQALAGQLGMADLARAWQMLLKGLKEVQGAPQPIAAAEMALIRLAYAADLPSPADLVTRLTRDGGQPSASAGAPAQATTSPPAPSGSGRSAGDGGATRAVASSAVRGGASVESAPRALARPQAEPAADDFPDDDPRFAAEAMSSVEAAPDGGPGIAPDAAPDGERPQPTTLEEVVALLTRRDDLRLQANLVNFVRLVRIEPGRIELHPLENAPRDLAAQLAGRLDEITGRRWMISVTTSQPGEPTLAEQRRERAETERARIAAHPMVRAVIDQFPGAAIDAFRASDAPDDNPDEDGER
ncbi:DNA polymerase III subunit gamma/tau [Oceanibacterium hippocampi]|uniref:DNA polymerase III subunit gamma/tau n=1 Tax=Oceanibacterium hippocampi TaxID=745714 RepID=A0A1Y5RTN2_9PROT|nr:DNA polymerase III subunit gamma/tau [Oceanibacterium hippocampi]SLN25239.1 DNA polymerase III subunit tau [Oceanibacterium hippocampi]